MSNNSNKSKNSNITIRKFRPDIEVLRAIAVIAVVISHSKIGLLGGFIGVDVFFVISGFLITKHLYDEIHNSGTISLKSFYARRILRIFPASMLVLLLTLLGSFLFLSPLQLINYCWDAFYSSISGVNYRLAISGTDYFQSTTTPSPFQHFWSLAVEEQFYLIWPLILLIFTKLILQKQQGRINNDFINFKFFNKTISVILFIIILISLFLSIKITGESQMWAYFGLHTRAWQLAIGALIAFNLPLLSKIPNKVASILSWLGFGALMTAFVLISETTIYPGIWALLPTLATALIVIAGTKATKFSFESFFDCKIARWIGKISYSLYLIHWPIFVIVFYQLGDNIKFTDRIAAIIISFLLTILSWALVENPVRFNKVLKSSFKETAKIGLFLVLLVSTVSFGLQYLQNLIIDGNVISVSADAISENQIFQKLKTGLDLKIMSQDLQKPIEQVAKETGSSCIAIESIKSPSEGLKCRLGDKNGKKTIVLLGDSHANQWVDTLDIIAQQNNYLFIPFSKAGCSMTDIKHFNPLLKRDYTECYSYRSKAIEEITQIKPDIIITTELVYQNSTPETYTAFIQKLQSISKQVVRLTDTPRPTQNIPECLSKNVNDVQKCSFSIEGGKNNGGIEKEKENTIAKNLGVKIIDTTKWFCVDFLCPTIVNQNLVYNDDSHISEEYAKYLKNIFKKQLFEEANEYAKIVNKSIETTKLPTTLLIPLDKVPKDNFRNGSCIAQASETVPSTNSICILGNIKSSKTVILTGDSHAHQWTQAIDEFALNNNYKLITYTKSGCPMFDISANNFLLNRDFTECYTWRKKALEEIEKIQPELIITSSLTYSNSSTPKYTDYLNKLKSMSKKVIRIEDTPHPNQNIPECLSKNQNNIQICNLNLIKSTQNPMLREEEVKSAKEAGVFIVDFTELFCSGQTCPAIINNIVVYHDDSHISNTYATSLANKIEQNIQKIQNSLNKRIDEGLSIKELPVDLLTSLEKASSDRTNIPCISDNLETNLPSIDSCLVKNTNQNKLMVLIGDSHAYQWAETFDKVAKDYNYNYLVINKYGCPLQDIKTTNITIKRDYVECYEWRQKLFIKIAELKPDIIITSNLTYKESNVDKQKEYLTKLQASSKNIIVMEDTPFPGNNIPECIAKHQNDIQKCSFNIKNYDQRVVQEIRNELELASNIGVNVITTNDLFCIKNICPVIIDKIIVYEDDSHFTNTYANYLIESIKEKLIVTIPTIQN